MMIVPKNVLFQRFFRINSAQSIINYALENISSINPNDIIAVVSVEGRLFELNLSAGIIFEEILHESSIYEIESLLLKVFYVDKDTIHLSVKRCLDYFISIGALKSD